MVKNVGSADKLLRIVVGAVLIVVGLLPRLGLAALVPGLWNWVLVLVGIVLVLTAVVGFCPAYTLIGLNTDKK